MKLRNALAAVTLAIVPAITASGQLTTTENPFAETGQQEDTAVFDTSQAIGLKGTITQKVSRATHSPSYLFFRIETRRFTAVSRGVFKYESGTETWTIRIYDSKLKTFANNCRECLIDDYTPEMQALRVGAAVTLKGYPSKNGDHRLLADVRNLSTSPLNSN